MNKITVNKIRIHADDESKANAHAFFHKFCLVADIIRYYIKCDTVANPFKKVHFALSQ